MGLADDFLMDAKSAPGQPAPGMAVTLQAQPSSLADQFLADANSTPPPPPPPPATLGSRLREVGHGINKFAMTTLPGIPGDTLANVIDLGKAAIGTPWLLAGKVPPEVLEPSDRTKLIGTSDFIADQFQKHGAGGIINMEHPEDRSSRVMYAGGQGAGAVLLGKPQNAKEAIFSALSSGGTSAAGQAATEITGNQQVGTLVQLLAPTVAAKAGEKLRSQPRAAQEPLPAPAQPATTVAEPQPLAQAKPRYKLIPAPDDQAAGAVVTQKPRVKYVPPQPGAAIAQVLSSDNAATQVTPPKIGGVPTAEQALRKSDLQTIGLEPNVSIRNGALTGDLRKIENEVALAKDAHVGDQMKAQLQLERQKLNEYSGKLVSDTGAMHADPLAKGNAIYAPLDALADHFHRAVTGLYNQARAASQGAPLTNLPSVGDLITNQRSSFTGTTEGSQLLRGVKSRLQEIGAADKDGVIKPITVDQAESLRQYLNEQWTPQTNKIISKMKDAITDDVTQAAGGDLFARARALRAQQAKTLEEPAGIAAILDASGPKGVNRKIPVEQIAQKVASMPTAQVAHIKDVLTNRMPDSLKEQGLQAWNEIRGQVVQNITSAPKLTNGWQPSKLDKAMNQMGQSRLSLFLEPTELTNLGVLQRSGHYLSQVDINPSGTTSSLVRVLQATGKKAPPAVGAAVGGAVGGYTGATTGYLIGQGVSKGVDSVLARRKQSELAKALKQTP